MSRRYRISVGAHKTVIIDDCCTREQDLLKIRGVAERVHRGLAAAGYVEDGGKFVKKSGDITTSVKVTDCGKVCVAAVDKRVATATATVTKAVFDSGDTSRTTQAKLRAEQLADRLAKEQLAEAATQLQQEFAMRSKEVDAIIDAAHVDALRAQASLMGRITDEREEAPGEATFYVSLDG